MTIFNKIISYIPKRFFLFLLVGLAGTTVHIATLSLFFWLLKFQFIISQAIATYIAMTCNYFINNRTTFKDKKHKGKKLLSGLFSFYIVCTLGALISIQLAQFLYTLSLHWAISGFLGGVSGSLFNFAFSSFFTWKTHKA